ncbi:hypothetical protein [Streptomyces globisporus]|uniref:hypothetical protein n=1 Tax=Streptomyces globisporus TaxID=1908 RepID=UPI001FCA1079|nr:hypothetical protein [Streptomyces globisporus]
MTFSRLLAETFERAGLGLYDPRFLTGVPEALDMIENAAEVTVDGKQLIAAVRKEISGTRSAAGKITAGASRRPVLWRTSWPLTGK